MKARTKERLRRFGKLKNYQVQRRSKALGVVISFLALGC